MRLGKFEKWLLIQCYRKTVLWDLPMGWRLPRGAPKRDNDYFSFLLKSEVLLNYYPELHLSEKVASCDWDEKFKTTALYRKALVTVSRTWQQLLDKGLVEWHIETDLPWSGLALTDAGMEVGRYLLDVNSS